MLPESIDTGLATGILVAIAGGLVQLWVWKIRGKTAEKLKGMDHSSHRDNRALEAEDKAFGYMQRALEDARTELDDEREDAKARIAHIRREADSEIGRMTLALAQEQAAKIEALEDAFNTRTLAQALQSRHDLERESLLAELRLARWREQEARLWIQQALAIIAAPHEAPPVPHWVSSGETKRLPPADTEE